MSGAPLNKKKFISLISSTPRHFKRSVAHVCPISIFEVLQHNRIQIKELGSKHMGLLSVQSGRNCSFVSVRRQKVICESFVCEHCACINSRQDCIVCGAVLSLQDQRVTINVVNLRKWNTARMWFRYAPKVIRERWIASFNQPISTLQHKCSGLFPTLQCVGLLRSGCSSNLL